MWRKLADVAFWIGTSLYFGGLVAIGAAAAPGVFSAARDANVSMPGIAAPPLTMSTQVGGEIFGEVLRRFSYLEAIGLALALVGIAGWILGHRHVRRSTWIALILWVMVAAMASFDAAWMRPRILEQRTQVRREAPQHVADAANTPWPARSSFDSLHTWDETLGRLKGYTLLAMIIVIAWRGLADKRTAASADHRDIMRPTVNS